MTPITSRQRERDNGSPEWGRRNQRTLSEGLPQLSGHPLHGLGRDLGAKVPVKWRRGPPLLDRMTVTPWV